MIRTAGEGEEPGVAATEAEAFAQAKATGQRVEIGAFRSERREVYANPDGTTTAEEHAQPVRVVRDGHWVPVDTTLVTGGDGTVAPAASTLGVRLSGGGDTPLVSVERAGRALTLDWRGDLPSPTLDGDTASYPEVLPGVDLKVTVGFGGFSHLLVIKNAEAAANPALAELDFDLSTAGLDVRDSGDGGLTAVDTATGSAVLEAPTPVMWDSTTGEPPTETAAGSAAAAEPAADGEPTDTGIVSEVRSVPVGVRVDGDTLTLVPDRTMLTDPATQWPVYVDPVWESTGNSAWAMVASGYPTAKTWKFGGTEGVGRCPVSSGQCNGVGVKRLYYALPTPYAGKNILSAEFRVTMTHTYSSAARAVSLYRSGGGISAGTHWNNQPGMSALQDSKSPTAKQSSCTGTNQNVGFNATGAVREAAAYGWSTTTFGMRANDEGDSVAWKRFCGNAILSVNYNRAPDQPSQANLTMSPGGQCVSGASRPYVDTLPTLYAILTDPDHTAAHVEQLVGEVSVSWEQPAGTRNTRTYQTVTKASGSRFQLTVPSGIPENVVVSWNIRAGDGYVWGATSASCEFIYDKTQPAAPDIDSAEYLPADASETTAACAEDDVWRGSVGSYGTFTFDSTSTDAVQYRYGFNTNPSPSTVATPTSAGGPASVRWLPARDGPNFVTVQAVDRAGLTSTIATCVFLVAARPAVGEWGLGDEETAAAAIDGRGLHPATRGAGATFGVPGPGCQHTGSLCTLDRAVRLTGEPNSYLATRSAGLVPTAGGFAVTAWVLLTDDTRDRVAVSQDGSGEPGFTLGFDAATKKWSFAIPVGDVMALGGWSATSTAVAAKNVWTHLAGVYDPVRQTIQLYVNGQAQPTAARRAPWKSRGAIQIGRKLAKSGYTGHWVGDLADVTVFDRMIVPSEITAMVRLQPVRRAYWPLNAASGGTSPAYGGGESLQLGGGARIYSKSSFGEPPLTGTGHLLLDGVDDYARTETPIVDLTGSYTVSLRARLTGSTCGKDMTVISQSGARVSGFALRCAASDRWELRLPHSDATDAAATIVYNGVASPEAGQSGQHLALTYNAIVNEVRLYVDGQLVTTAVGVHTSTWAAGGGLQVGRALVNGVLGEYFAGAVDDVRVYVGVADQTDVQLLAHRDERVDL